VELSPETCRVKPLRRINTIVASCWNYFTMFSIVRNMLVKSLLQTDLLVRRQLLMSIVM